MIRKLTILAALLLQIGVNIGYAVTDKEMEQARVIAAKAYLRYANDGSGYLDEIKPKSMADLEAKIKPKEKANLKAFKAVGYPRDYASWDKAKLVEYWSVTFFKSPGLTEKGKMARARVRKNVSAMKVAPPVSDAQKKAEAEKKAAEEKQAAEEKKAADAVKAAESAKPETQSAPADGNASADLQQLADSVSNIEAKALEGLAENADDIDKEKSHTWIYLLVLGVLVAVVVWLVTFASNVMKRNSESSERESSASEAETRKYRAQAEQADKASKEMQTKYAAAISRKDEEIIQLNAKVDQLNRENYSLKRDMEALVAETGVLRTRLTEAQRQLEDIRQAAAVAATRVEPEPQPVAPAAVREPERVAPAPVAPAPAPMPSPAPSAPREAAPAARPEEPRHRGRVIYLGRVNERGIFVRADRELTVGNTVFTLETTDGYAGTFRVAANPGVWEVLLENPGHYLLNGCTGEELEATDGFSRIVTDSPGTAIFDSGCWRVIRKARIHYE